MRNFVVVVLLLVAIGCGDGPSSPTAPTRLTDSETNEQVGPDIQMRAATGPLSNLPSLTIRPQEIVALTSAGTLGSDVASRTVRVQLFPTWNNVSCP